MAKKKTPKKVTKATDAIEQQTQTYETKSDYPVTKGSNNPACRIGKYVHLFDVKSAPVEALVIPDYVSAADVEYWDSENLRLLFNGDLITCELRDRDGLTVTVLAPIVIIREQGDTFTFLPVSEFYSLFSEVTEDWERCFPVTNKTGPISEDNARSLLLTEANLIKEVIAIDSAAELSFDNNVGWRAIFTDACRTTHIAMPGQTLVTSGDKDEAAHVLVLNTEVFNQLFDRGIRA